MKDETNPPTTSSSVVLVNIDTEIYVAPQPRGGPKVPAAAEPPKALTPAAPTRSTSPQKSRNSVKEASLRVVPPAVAAQWGAPGISSDDAHAVGGDRVGWVAPATLAKVRKRVGEASSATPLHVSLHLRKEKKEESKEQPVEGEEKTEQEDEPPLEAWLVGWDEMPADAVVFSGELEPQWTSWGIAKASASSSKASRGKPNGSQSSQRLDISSTTDNTLAGVDSVIDKALSYFRRSALTEHARPLLLNGSKGSGKTSIAKVVGHALEADRSILSRELDHVPR